MEKYKNLTPDSAIIVSPIVTNENAQEPTKEQQIAMSEAIKTFIDRALGIVDVDGVTFRLDFSENADDPTLTSDGDFSDPEYDKLIPELKSAFVGFGIIGFSFCYESFHVPVISFAVVMF